MGTEGPAAKKATMTAKAIIHQRFGDKACYRVEEVHEAAQNGCPGLAIPRKGPCLYRCRLELPDISVVSETFKKKKDSEQAAAQKALLELGIHSTANSPANLEEAWRDLISRLEFFFSDEFLGHQHPLSGHLRAALRRDGDLSAVLPISIIAACDGKVGTLCKFIDPKVDTNPCLAVSIIKEAANKSSGSLTNTEGQLWIRPNNLYPSNILESSVMQEFCTFNNISLDALYIPDSMGKPVVSVRLEVPATCYYLDVIAEQLGLKNASEILISRPIGRANSEVRLHFAASEMNLLKRPLSISGMTNLDIEEGSFNTRASYLSSQDIYGNAILASIGYTWRSKDLFNENISLQSYYRLFLNKTPSGIYKLSRDAVLTTQLPVTYSIKTNWRGSLPRDIVCTFCRQHRLSEPVFTISSYPGKAFSELSSPSKKVRIADSKDLGESTLAGSADVTKEESETECKFTCEVKILSKLQDLIMVCSSKDFCKSQSDCIQTASLKVLSWLDAFFQYRDMPPELQYSISDALQTKAKELDITFYAEHISNEFKLCPSAHSDKLGVKWNCVKSSNSAKGDGTFAINIEGPDSGVCPSSGSLVHLSYSVSLTTDSGNVKELVESCEEFEYEMGAGAVINNVEAAVAQMSVGQSAFFLMEDLPDQELLLAASNDSSRIESLLKLNTCCLEYCITLLKIVEPLEERMEQALFSPPLSKQRVEYALRHIKESQATSLVDFGCGSGSLLESLLDYFTSLETIVGVDISHKSLARAAKVLHSKLSKDSDTKGPSPIKSAIIYDGSITEYDSRLCGFDIGTCLEVIEHMEEHDVNVFGDVVLGLFRPKTFIVSTPNYEYNVLLQGSTPPISEDSGVGDDEAKTQVGACKFRNHDHKFEWTRNQFELWASELATKHSYVVEFGGVGGCCDTEPGYASQIAVFRRESCTVLEAAGQTQNTHIYNVIWELNRCSSISA